MSERPALSLLICTHRRAAQVRQRLPQVGFQFSGVQFFSLSRLLRLIEQIGRHGYAQDQIESLSPCFLR